MPQIWGVYEVFYEGHLFFSREERENDVFVKGDLMQLENLGAEGKQTCLQIPALVLSSPSLNFSTLKWE